MQCVAVCCSVLQCVVVCCSVLQSSLSFTPSVWRSCVLQCVVVVCCSALQCSALQCSAVLCSVVQCVAVRCGMSWRVASTCSPCHMLGVVTFYLRFIRAKETQTQNTVRRVVLSNVDVDLDCAFRWCTNQSFSPFFLGMPTIGFHPILASPFSSGYPLLNDIRHSVLLIQNSTMLDRQRVSLKPPRPLDTHCSLNTLL